nr:sugar transferase [Actinomycetota bacterium]
MAEIDPPASLAERYSNLSLQGLQRPRVDRRLRALDVLIASVSLLLLAPLALVIASAIRLTSGPPVLYRGARVGRNGRVFTMRKFRTLRSGAESRLGEWYGRELDERTPAEVTGLGRWLRASQLDEMPQLWN